MADILKIKGLHKSYGDLKVLKGLDLSVPEGCIFGFVGQNGAGKTTAMKIVLGLLDADAGEITVCGENVCYGKTVKSIGYLPDVPEFYSYMKPAEYLCLCGEISGMPKPAIKEQSGRLLKLTGLSGINRKIGGFSRGMKQRLGIAQALLNEPKLLICDEPTSALDPAGRKEILDIIARIKGHTTVVFSTHILSDVERVCDHAAVLHEGKIAICGTLSEIKKRQIDVYMAEFPAPQEAEKFISLLPENTQSCLSKNTVTVRNARAKTLLEILAANNLNLLKFELLEPTLEDLYMELIK